MDIDDSKLDWDYSDSLATKLSWHLKERFLPDCLVSKPIGSEGSGLFEMNIRNINNDWVVKVLLYTYPYLYPSHLPNLVSQIQKSGKESVIKFISAPKLSKESRAFLRDAGIAYVDLSGGFFLPLKINQEEYYFDIDRDEYSEEKFWRVKGTSGLPGVSAGRVAIYRTLLVNKEKTWGVRELGRAIALDPGTTSRYLKETVNAGWVERRGRSEHVLADPTAMLDYWASMTKRLRKYFVQRCILHPKDYSELRQIVKRFIETHKDTYHTLWSGAEFYGQYQKEPIIALYCSDIKQTIKLIGARRALPRHSANLWLLRRTDKALGQGAIEREEERVVCWQQVYVDLFNAPLRGKSIARMLRREMEERNDSRKATSG